MKKYIFTFIMIFSLLSLMGCAQESLKDIVNNKENNTYLKNDYTGIKDELGNENRAINIKDLIEKKAFAPYIRGCKDVAIFIDTNMTYKEKCKANKDSLRCYDDCANEEFYIICDYVCENFSDTKWSNCYNECSGNSINLDCKNSCWDD